MPGGQDHALAPRTCSGQPTPNRLAGFDHELGIDGDRSRRRVWIRCEARGPAHEPQYLRWGERPRQAGQPELLVEVPLAQQPDIAQHVVEGMAEGGAGDPPLKESAHQLLTVVNPPGPPFVDRGQLGRMGFDNVHPQQS